MRQRKKTNRMHRTDRLQNREKWQVDVLLYMPILRNNKNKICKEPGKLIQPSFGEGTLRGEGIASSIADAGMDLFIHKGIPWLGKKSLEMGRYYGSEAMRNPKLQKKAIDFALEKATPFI